VLVLVSFGLVLLATILLVVGLLTDDGLNLIYLSIACSAGAAVVLFLAFRRAKPARDVPATPPAPILPEGAEPERVPAFAAAAPAAVGDVTTIQPAVAAPEAELADAVNPGATPTADTEPAVGTEEPVEAEEPADVEEPVGAGAATDDDWVADDDWADAGEFEVEFPIADYDDLSVDEIMPLLPQLYSDELEVVAERERSTKARQAILARLAELAATGTEADAMEAEHAGEPEPTVEPEPAVEPEPPLAARPAPQVPSLADDEWDDGEAVFPIADYDELTADQVISLLPQLEDDELEDVKAREVAGQGRKSVITEIDRQLGLVAVGADDAAWRAEAPAAAPAAQEAPAAADADGSLLAIAGYDGLTVAQIRPLLAGLSHAELRAVLEHEVARDDRRTIVADIERRLEQPEAAAAPAVATPAPAEAAVTASPAKATARKAGAKKAVAKTAPAKKAAATPAATKKAAAKKATAKKATAKKAAAKKAAAKKAAAKKAAGGRFPIARYDELSVSEIRPRLADLSARQLQQVRDRELAGAGRKTILAEIDRRLG